MLRETLALRRRYGIRLRGEAIPPQAQATMAALGESIDDCSTANHSDALERADLGAELADWLDEQAAPSELAGDLVDAGITREKLAPLTELISQEAFNSGLRILAADYQVLCLTREIETPPAASPT